MLNNDPQNQKPHISRRRFIQSSAGAVLACNCLEVPLLAEKNAPMSGRPAETPRAYICPPCGLPCDKLTFDEPGNCPQCGMTLIPTTGTAGVPPSVAILLFGGAQLIDFAGPWEVFGTAGFLVHTVAEKADVLTAVFGAKLTPDYTFDSSPKTDVLLIPGGGVWQEAINNERLIQWIQEHAKSSQYVMSVCTGAFLLQKAGLLDGQTVTATYGMIDDLAGPDTKVVYDKRFVDNGKIITTAGLSAGIDGALHVVSRLLGDGVAQSVALEMEYNWDPAGSWARAALADRFLPDGLANAKAKIKGSQAKMVSTAGGSDHWETKILVSEPHTSEEVFELMKNRLAADHGTSGMFKPVSHIRGTPQVIPTSPGKLKWSFTDDEGHDWKGTCSVEPSTIEKNNFLVTFTLARGY